MVAMFGEVMPTPAGAPLGMASPLQFSGLFQSVLSLPSQFAAFTAVQHRVTRRAPASGSGRRME
jgi:hypothetical protein